MDEKILIVTENGVTEHIRKDVANLIVRLSGKYYFKHSPLVVRVMGPDGLLRYYRKASPLIVPDEDFPGTYILKSLCYLSEDGVYLNKRSNNVVKIGDKYYRKSYTTIVNDKVYLKTDEAIVQYGTGKYILKEDAVVLSNLYYRPETWWPKVKAIQIVNGAFINAADSIGIIDGPTGNLVYYHPADKIFARSRTINVVYDFQDKTNPQENRLVAKQAFSKDESYFISIVILPGILDIPIVVHKSKVNYFNQQIDNFIAPRIAEELDSIRNKINRLFSDYEEGENTAKIFKKIKEPFAGKQNIYTSSSFNAGLQRSSFKYTGGLRYSFGVEIETSQGLLPNSLIETLGISCVGDRSIGAGEYVTPPLLGDKGFNSLLEISNAINEHCLVDDRCGVHVHIGTISLSQGKKRFTKPTLINLIRLGALLEEELYTTLPPCREPTLYHCHSIRRWTDINSKNYPQYMGAYIFGPKEWWKLPQEVGHEYVEPYFKFDAYKLGSSLNKNTPIQRWQSGRYKWLNLIHAFHSEGHGTVEFRIFPGTTMYYKIANYVLFSMAFVNTADNHPELIKKGVTLKDIVDSAFSKSPEIRDRLNKFHEDRKNKFKRSTIYKPNEYWQPGIESLNLVN